VRAPLFVFLCACAPHAFADIGIGVSTGDSDAAILVPIRFSSILLEPQFGYSSSDFESPRSAPESTDGYSVGIGLFGHRRVGENLSIHYGGRLADFSEKSTSDILDFTTGMTLGESETSLDGYSVTPSVGFHYTISRIMIGAEIGWEYSEADWETSYEIWGLTGPVSNAAVAPFFFAAAFSAANEASTVSRSTVASLVFRYFFAPN
jgi:hypothetical protein